MEETKSRTVDSGIRARTLLIQEQAQLSRNMRHPPTSAAEMEVVVEVRMRRRKARGQIGTKFDYPEHLQPAAEAHLYARVA